MKVTVLKYNIAKFGTKAEKDTPLHPYTERRPKTATGWITEDKISQHDLGQTRRKLEEDERIGWRKSKKFQNSKTS